MLYSLTRSTNLINSCSLLYLLSSSLASNIFLTSFMTVCANLKQSLCLSHPLCTFLENFYEQSVATSIWLFFPLALSLSWLAPEPFPDSPHYPPFFPNFYIAQPTACDPFLMLTPFSATKAVSLEIIPQRLFFYVMHIWSSYLFWACNHLRQQQPGARLPLARSITFILSVL